MKTILFSGGIGDAYIVYCKLYSSCTNQHEHFTTIRFDNVTSYQKPIQEFFSLLPQITLAPSQPLEQLSEFRKKYLYIGVHALGQPFGFTHEQEPIEYAMTPFPQIPIRKQNLKGTHIGIQLHTGKERGNFKGLPLTWIKETIHNGPKNATWHLLGTGVNYDLEEIEQFAKKEHLINHVGKTNFLEWMSLIKSFNYYITPEGFSAFFALSQKVRCHIFYTIEKDLARIHPEWEKYASFEKVRNTISIFPLLKGKIKQQITPKPLKVKI